MEEDLWEALEAVEAVDSPFDLPEEAVEAVGSDDDLDAGAQLDG